MKIAHYAAHHQYWRPVIALSSWSIEATTSLLRSNKHLYESILVHLDVASSLVHVSFFFGYVRKISTSTTRSKLSSTSSTSSSATEYPHVYHCHDSSSCFVLHRQHEHFQSGTLKPIIWWLTQGSGRDWKRSQIFVTPTTTWTYASLYGELNHELNLLSLVHNCVYC